MKIKLIMMVIIINKCYKTINNPTIIISKINHKNYIKFNNIYHYLYHFYYGIPNWNSMFHQFSHIIQHCIVNNSFFVVNLNFSDEKSNDYHSDTILKIKFSYPFMLIITNKFYVVFPLQNLNKIEHRKVFILVNNYPIKHLSYQYSKSLYHHCIPSLISFYTEYNGNFKKYKLDLIQLENNNQNIENNSQFYPISNLVLTLFLSFSTKSCNFLNVFFDSVFKLNIKPKPNLTKPRTNVVKPVKTVKGMILCLL